MSWSASLSPEFAFEHVVSNVKSAAGQPGYRLSGRCRRQPRHLGCLQQRVLAGRVPHRSRLAIVRAYDFGEGGYGTMESNIRMLLSANGVSRPAATHRRPRQDAHQRVDHSRELCRVRTTQQRGRHAGPSTTRRSSTTHRRSSPRTASPSAARGHVHSEEATAGSNANARTCSSPPTTSTWSWAGRARVGVSDRRATL